MVACDDVNQITTHLVSLTKKRKFIKKVFNLKQYVFQNLCSTDSALCFVGSAGWERHFCIYCDHEHCNFVIFILLSQVYFTYPTLPVTFWYWLLQQVGNFSAHFADACGKWWELNDVRVSVCERKNRERNVFSVFVIMLSYVRYTLSTSNSAIAALLCALYPHFPAHSTDNRWD